MGNEGKLKPSSLAARSPSPMSSPCESPSFHLLDSDEEEEGGNEGKDREVLSRRNLPMEEERKDSEEVQNQEVREAYCKTLVDLNNKPRTTKASDLASLEKVLVDTAVVRVKEEVMNAARAAALQSLSHRFYKA